MMRQGNTLFILHRHPKDESVAVFRALNADTAENYLRNSRVFGDAMKSLNFRAMVTTFYDETLLSIFKYISRELSVSTGSGGGYTASKLPDGQIRVVVQLGPKTSGGLSSTGYAQ